MNFMSSPEREREIQVLTILLRELPINGTLSYAKATEAIGRDVRDSARFSLLKARQVIEKETGARFGTVTKEGVKRLCGEDIPGIGAQARRRIGRTAKTAFKRLAGVTINDMDETIQRAIATERSMLGALSLATQERSRSKVADEVQTGSGELAVGRVLEILKK